MIINDDLAAFTDLPRQIGMEQLRLSLMLCGDYYFPIHRAFLDGT
jgi:hypothetical protein